MYKIVLLPLALCLLAARAEDFVLAEVRQGEEIYFEVYSAAQFDELNKFLQEQSRLAPQAMNQTRLEWNADASLRKLGVFPLAGFAHLPSIRRSGAYANLELATEKLFEAEDALYRQQSAGARMISPSNALVVQRKTLEAQARKSFDEKLVKAVQEAGLSAPSFKGLAREQLKKNPRFRTRRIERAALQALRYLASNQSGGIWLGGNGSPRVTACVAGLAMLAAEPGGRAYASNLDRIAREMCKSIAGKDGEPRDTMFANWMLGFRGIFLAEYYAHRPTGEVRAALQETVKLIQHTQKPNGCWHHGYGSVEHYEVHAAGLECLATLGLAKSYGLEVDEKAIERALASFSTDAGKVGYSTANGHFAPARTAGVAWAYFCCGQQGSAKFEAMSAQAWQHMTETKNDHASPGLHQMWRSLFCHMEGSESWNRYWDLFEERLLDLQEPDGSFRQAPWADANMEELCGPYYRTAMYALVLLAPRGNLQGLYLRSPLQAKLAAEAGRTAWLGIQVQPAGEALKISQVMKTAPAQAWGLKPGMLLLEINAKPVASEAALDELMAKLKPGDALTLTIQDAGPDAKPRRTEPAIALPRPLIESVSKGWK